ncbi:MAG: RDD family protein [Oryzihumus sp.]
MSEGGVSPVPHEARPYQGRPAGLVTRVLGSAIDGVVVCVALVAVYVGFNALRFVLDPLGFSFRGVSALFSVVAFLTVLVLYLTVAWATTGRTYGSHVMGLRVLTREGLRLPLTRALVRALLSAFFPIGLLWCAGRHRRSIQDVVVRTVVLYEWLPGHDPADPITRGG